MRLHRRLVLIGRGVVRIDLRRRVGKTGFEIADGAVGGHAAVQATRVLGKGSRGVEIVLARQGIVLDADHRGGGAGLFKRLGDHERDREAEIEHLVGVERGLGAREAVPQVHRSPWGLGRRVVFGQYEQHARHDPSLARVDRDDAALGNRGADDEAIGGGALRRIFEGIGRSACHLQSAIDAIDRKADQVGLRAISHDNVSSDANRLGQCGPQGSARERDLEVVVTVAARLLERGHPGGVKRRSRRRGINQRGFGLRRSPRLVGKAPERHARGAPRSLSPSRAATTATETSANAKEAQ